MGAQPSKRTRVSSRPTAHREVTSPDGAGTHQIHKDLHDLSLSSQPDASSNSERSSGQWTEQNDSQITGETPAGATSESVASSKSNLSSFLNSIIGNNSDGSTKSERKDDKGQKLSDLQEQKQQKKINKRNQKMQQQAAKQSRKQQQSPGPYQHQSASSTWSTLATTLSSSSKALSSRTRSASGVLSAMSVPSPTPGNAVSSTSPGPQGGGDTDQSRRLAWSTAANASQQETKPSKLSFIRGKPGFAWLEKRLPPASSGLDEASLSNIYWSYQQGQLLDEMETEAAKGYMDRVTDQHYLMKDVMGGNYHAPIDLTFKRVLENGCGAGDWTIDMASEMPETDFVGCPQIIATVRPTLRPRNCYFHSEVPLNCLPFPDEHFDLVYQRRQNVVLLATEWQRAVSELFRVLKPGGWVQILEPDLSLRGGGDLCRMAGEYCVRMFELTGRNPNVIHELQSLLESAGFANVTVKIWSIPLGWGGVIGQAMLVNQRQFVNEMEPIYVRQGHGTSEEYRGLTKGIFDEAVERKAYINYHVAVAQKPMSIPETGATESPNIHCST
ncbi:S-adenosyl-L-methionine-dependent methyltransferase [Gamsiella multidivaricata]|uniref:S-adenosyl-L-methionine-dependent methyltransferase n=1 Tax=Gamsiella multidivaricata TaxID=101098 RepID=UPI00222011EE|nr:S-adenosyl-L-methionine-dependent methyltransferase [Gamsiella multidivaricata]KAI7822163.1 S-adenosyl-L-methionine-dependent methyltransferase [Gamsiella multidivaricata]